MPQVPRIALDLIGRHGGQWRSYLSESYRAVYSSILSNCKHTNYDLKAAAFRALETYLREVRLLLGRHASFPPSVALTCAVRACR